MRISTLVGLLAAASCVFAAESGIPQSEYSSAPRYAAESIARLADRPLWRKEREHGDLRSGFFQNSDFYYLTGWREPGAILVIAPTTETILIPKRNAERSDGRVRSSRLATRM